MGKIIFINIPKNASTTLYEAFKDHDVMRTATAKADPIGGFHRRHRGLSYAKDHIEDYRQYPVVCCSRNPYDKMVSAYEFALRKELWKPYIDTEPTFEQFVMYYCCTTAFQSSPDIDVRDKHFYSRTQTDWITVRGVIQPHRVLRFEHLSDDYTALAEELQLDLPELPYINATPHKHWSTYYDDALANVVRTTYLADFFTFNYSQDRHEDARERLTQ